jgi:putative FmdB family regulatory protein
MPVYTYRCENCGVQFERSQKFADQPLTRCPECGKKSLHKVYTPVGIVFKGSGFYATDHRSPSGMTSSRNEEKEKAAESASSTTPKTESETKTKTAESSPSTSAPAATTSSTPTPSNKE